MFASCAEIPNTKTQTAFRTFEMLLNETHKFFGEGHEHVTKRTRRNASLPGITVASSSSSSTASMLEDEDGGPENSISAQVYEAEL